MPSTATPLQLLLAGLCALVFTATGCFSDPPKHADVEGIVMLNGKPLAGATVTFAPRTGASGNVQTKTDKDGRFSVRAKIGVNYIAVAKFINNGPPRTPDEYIIDMIKNNKMDRHDKSQPMIFENAERVVPQKYESPASSGLKELVDEDGSKNKYRFELKGKVRYKKRAYGGEDPNQKGKKGMDKDDPLDDLNF